MFLRQGMETILCNLEGSKGKYRRGHKHGILHVLVSKKQTTHADLNCHWHYVSVYATLAQPGMHR